MHRNTHPYWIIDPETLNIKGIAHKTCRDYLDYQTVEHRLTTPVGVWQPDLVSDPPSRDLIEFAVRMIKYRFSLPRARSQWMDPIDFRILILTSMIFEASNVEEFLELPKVKKLFDWWGSPENRDPLSREYLEEIKKRLRENLK